MKKNFILDFLLWGSVSLQPLQVSRRQANTGTLAYPCFFSCLSREGKKGK